MRATDEKHQAGGPYLAGGTQQAGEFLDRFGDAIDDRIAEIVDEVLDQRAERVSRPRPLRLAVTVLLAALAASVLLRHSVLAVCAVWLSCAVIYLAALRFSAARRS